MIRLSLFTGRPGSALEVVGFDCPAGAISKTEKMAVKSSRFALLKK